MNLRPASSALSAVPLFNQEGIGGHRQIPLNAAPASTDIPVRKQIIAAPYLFKREKLMVTALKAGQNCQVKSFLAFRALNTGRQSRDLPSI